MRPSRKPPLTLCIFIDALGWELMRGRPFLDEILTARRPLQTVFGYSCTCCPTILTGRMPTEHGHLSFYYYDPANSPFSNFKALAKLPRFLSERGRVRRWLSKWVARRLGFTGYFQLYNVPFDRLRFFDYLEQRDIYQPNGLRGGAPTIFDWLRANDVPFFLSDWRAKEDLNLRALESALYGGDLRYAYLYLADLDALLHAHGTASPPVEKKLSSYETQLRRVIAIARRWHEVHVYLFSDHGMTDVVDRCDLISRVEAVGLEFGRDYSAMYDSTMARFWFHRPHAREAILEVLSEEPRGSVLSDLQLRDFGCDFPGHRYGELFFLLQPGVLLCPSYMGQRPIAGMHGYTPDHIHAVATFATNVEPAPRPRRLDNLFSVMQNDVALNLPCKVVC